MNGRVAFYSDNQERVKITKRVIKYKTIEKLKKSGNSCILETSKDQTKAVAVQLNNNNEIHNNLSINPKDGIAQRIIKSNTSTALPETTPRRPPRFPGIGTDETIGNFSKNLSLNNGSLFVGISGPKRGRNEIINEGNKVGSQHLSLTPLKEDIRLAP